MKYAQEALNSSPMKPKSDRPARRQGGAFKRIFSSFLFGMFAFGNLHASEERISDYALLPYTQDGYPSLVQKYGSRLKEIEAYRKKAALMALASGKCDYVEMSDLSTKSDLGSLVFWVQCSNKQRIYLTEAEIDKGSQVKTQAEKSWNQEDAIAACKSEIKKRALLPSKVDIHEILGTSIYKAEITQNVVVTMDFDALNAMGNKLPYTAKCYFEPGGIGSINILDRQ